jgi:hypothetical protein
VCAHVYARNTCTPAMPLSTGYAPHNGNAILPVGRRNQSARIRLSWSVLPTHTRYCSNDRQPRASDAGHDPGGQHLRHAKNGEVRRSPRGAIGPCCRQRHSRNGLLVHRDPVAGGHGLGGSDQPSFAFHHWLLTAVKQNDHLNLRCGIARGSHCALRRLLHRDSCRPSQLPARFDPAAGCVRTGTRRRFPVRWKSVCPAVPCHE